MKQRTTPSILLAAGILLIGTTFLFSCAKNNDAAPVDAVDEEEVAEAVTQAVSANSGGVAVTASDAAIMTTNYSAMCGMSKDTAIAHSSIAGAVVTYHADAQWHWMLTCAPAARFDFALTSHLSYDAPRMSSNDSLSATLAVTGLEPAAPNYTMNMSLTRKGSQASKILRKHSFTSTIIVTGTNIAVSKTTYLVQSGTASVTISGATSGGRSFQYAGTLVFTGNKTATLTFASGATYNIQW
ncbi:hypothetical protein SAMN04488505_104200 [Chitinophaga rupis]|uniref:Lipoprotein n=1 Tax=Chitinophaga rupis TaxID=573321 RepID=A0A1H7XW60_9BACT|nr:hypothetical protein [Chitinophaga rupis]SEM37388.1 hypothetical protein SAMN04488505_104200 [Chitinophaga rupis]